MTTTSIARGFNGHFDRLGRPLRNNARQTWEIGQVVNVGFLKGLTVVGNGGEGWLLRSDKGVFYGFQAHQGVSRLTDSEVASLKLVA